MKSYWLFACESGTISRATAFYKVAVGVSAYDQKILAKVQQKFDNCRDALLSVYCSEMADFLCRVGDSLGYDSYSHFAAVQVRRVDCRELSAIVFHSSRRSFLPRRKRSFPANQETI